MRSSLPCGYGSDMKLSTNGFSSNYDSNENSYCANTSKFDSSSEFYSPWSHRTFLSSRQPSANNESFVNKPNAGQLMSPNGVNLDALVSKLIADDDNANDFLKTNESNLLPNRYSHLDDSNAMITRNRLPDQPSYWSIKETPNYAKQQMKMEVDPNMNLFAQSKPCFDSSFNYAAGDYVPQNNKMYHYNNTQFWKSDVQNLRGDSFNNFIPNLIQQPYEQTASIQKNVSHREQYNQQMMHNRQHFVSGNQAQPQIRSIRAAVRNSSLTGIAPQNDLQYQIERCFEQFKMLERERKKIEQELTEKFPGKKISSANNIAIPRLPQNCSRIDRLIVDQYKEHAKVITLIAKMEMHGSRQIHEMVHESVQKWLETIRQLQFQRKGDLLPACRPRLNNVPEDVNDYICSQISLVVHELCVKTRSARTALWCAAISTLET
ncbi:hypothetical protein B4U80_01497 [Leptotrombidium deliense]|uniref:Uncharacterized protein n=1 Tax=Leptotrombidium deliense TaxID=299467 RepID=A0A443SX03_9ACAR|nr:hypothetical protein B4U80_01497 [Leptotrombidium deliense]